MRAFARIGIRKQQLLTVAPFNIAEQTGGGSGSATGGGFHGGVRVRFTPTANFTVTGLAWASGVESAGSPQRVVRILADDGTELRRSAVSTTSFRGASDYLPAAPLNLVSPLTVIAGTAYWADAIVVGATYGTNGYLNRRQTTALVSAGSATFSTTQKVNGLVDPGQGYSWANPSGPITTNQNNGSDTAYERVIIYGY